MPTQPWHVELQPSPEVVSPSSHVSGATTCPSPQVVGHAHVASSSVDEHGVPPNLGVVVIERLRFCEHVWLPPEKMHAPKLPHADITQSTGASVLPFWLRLPCERCEGARLSAQPGTGDTGGEGGRENG